MTLSREIVLDLLPVYLAGEASDQTRKIVEDYLARDPEIAALVAAEDPALPQTPDPKPDQEMRSIHRTRGILRRRSWLLAGTIFFCLMPVSVYMGPDGASWLVKENLSLAVLFAMIGLTLGIVYVTEGRKLRITGL